MSSTKRNDDLRANQVAEIEHLIELNEIETGRGANQIGTLQRPETDVDSRLIFIS